MSYLASGYGDWILEPGFPLRLEEITAGKEFWLGDGVTLMACDTPHTEESLAFAVRHRGASLVYTGDTGPSTALARWAHGCDLLLAECSLPDERAIDIHLTPRQAGALARDAQTRRLVLTHFYPPVLAVEDPVPLAAELFAGDIVAARDGDRFEIEVG
jgi:ribonuclease BN (tRNA processing enzyme)